jgi:hypothetical protein
MQNAAGRSSPSRCGAAATSTLKWRERGRAITCGGIGALHLLGHKLGLAREIDERLHLLKRH